MLNVEIVGTFAQNPESSVLGRRPYEAHVANKTAVTIDAAPIGAVSPLIFGANRRGSRMLQGARSRGAPGCLTR
jgi:hypothetical protein